MRAFFYLLGTLFLLSSCGGPAKKKLSLKERAEVPYLKGESRTIFPASPNPEKDKRKSWFTNDHCFVEDTDGTLHWIGINNPYPPEGKRLYRYHPYLGHLTTTDPTGKWTRQPHAIDESEGTEYLGAPFIVKHEESGRWVMVVETWLDNRRLEVCWSDDLKNWERTKTAILPEKLWLTSRDPHIMKGPDGKYWIHIVATGNKGAKQSQVLRIRTKDFVNFEDPETILGINDNTWATMMESPFLVKRNDLWYLFFTYAHRRYAETIVVVSENPDHFDFEKNTLTTLFGHAAEIFSYKGKTYISSCGPEDKHFLNSQSVTLAELGWLKPVENDR
ncbi:hypothetical protein FUAX_46960 (plasmid) [Fulvitalea axinellae]|uniref:Glycosyl hydrolase family 32 N-terminal domain-containing protein n=1 Tax=Fulvitalea axinellae TaxID=1182444 RepID=A0AAU9D0K7_9BACT|nr:hypothetical protein FUAX_46960 [Fulvitalea axinellae]